ncbi:hypothetical protein KAJ77_00675 [bacterium]|nr:hypothetical protein [bacterium]
MVSPEEIKLENRRIRALRILTDLTFQRLCVERMNIVEAREAVHELRKAATNMFPGKGGVFDLVIAPRLDRVIMERFGETTLILN